MKTQINSLVFGMFIFLFLVSCSYAESDGVKDISVSFAKAEMYYFYDDFVDGVGSYGIALSNGDPRGTFTELYIDFASDHFKDALRAVPAEGVYTFSDSFTEYTFNNAYSSYIEKKDGEEIMFGLIGGEFSLSRSGSGYLLQYAFKLGNGKILKGRYEGNIAGMYDSTIASDMALDFDAIGIKGAKSARVNKNTWSILLWGVSGSGNTDERFETLLMIHSEEAVGSLPVGNFPMANNIGEQIGGTAEPASAFTKEIDGSHFIGSDGNIAWSVPGEGFVEIAQIKGEEDYTISFLFKDPNGYAVSGEYTGEIGYYTRGGDVTGSLFDSGRH